MTGHGNPFHWTPDQIAAKAKEVRRHIVKMTAAAGSGHPGGSLSAVEILCSLYFNVLRHDPKNPRWEDRDRFILSKGHATPLLYSVLAEAGYYPVDQLLTFRKLGSLLQGHPDKRIWDTLEASTGSLGQGLSIGIGMAISARLDRKPWRVYVVIGDGESQEGQVWEAATVAGHQKLDNLTCILDYNGIQNDTFVTDETTIEPVVGKWQAFNWHTIEINGHDIPQVLAALEEARCTRGKPTMIIAHTVKGKGVSFMENNPEWHGKAPNAEQLALALKELV